MTLIRSRALFLIVSSIVCLAACSVRTGPTESVRKAWWVKDLAMFRNARVTVTDEEEHPLGRFSTRSLRNLSQAKIGVTEASGLYSELVLVEGTEPDAFAGFFKSRVLGIPAGTPVIVLSLGMVELLGHDTAAAAYLIGHETGHLLKGHVDANETRDVLLRRIRVLTEAGANDSARPATDSVPFTVSRTVVRYTDEQELEAREAGMRYATAAGYDRAGARRLVRLLHGASAGGTLPFLGQHLLEPD